MVSFGMGTRNLVLPYRQDIPLSGQSGRPKLAKSRVDYARLWPFLVGWLGMALGETSASRNSTMSAARGDIVEFRWR